jgi:pimeloyl-ACP methyl ester carboxylesterase
MTNDSNISFLPPETANLTEATSINLVRNIQCQEILTPLAPRAIATTFIRQGTGDTPILLLHGFDSSLLEFRRLLPHLAPHQPTWAVDLLGFGFTERLSGLIFNPLTLKTHLYYFWKNMIQKPVILVGASMGGATAIDFTLTYPHIVDKLILLDSAGVTNPPVLGKFMFPPLDYLATAFLRNLWVRQKISESAYYDKTLANSDAQLCAALHLKCSGWSEALISFTKNGGYGSFLEQLSQIKQPTLILWGKNDQILATKDAYLFQSAIPNSILTWIKNSGHVPHLEQPAITAEHILDFSYGQNSHTI